MDSQTIQKNKRKTKKGIVISDKMQKTLVVRVQRTLLHPRYGKVITLNKKYYAHYDGSDIKVGDEVSIIETRPLSKLKRWRVVSK